MDGYIRKTWDAAGSVIPTDLVFSVTTKTAGPLASKQRIESSRFLMRRASIEGVKTNPSRCLHSNACDYILELLSHLGKKSPSVCSDHVS